MEMLFMVNLTSFEVKKVSLSEGFVRLTLTPILGALISLQRNTNDLNDVLVDIKSKNSSLFKWLTLDLIFWIVLWSWESSLSTIESFFRPLSLPEAFIKSVLVGILNLFRFELS